MSTQVVETPFQFFTDANGRPLESGYLYIGIVDLNPETNPVSVYWDFAQTIPAAQPIRTLNGYPVRNGSAATIYVGSEYSLEVKDKNQALVFSHSNSAATNPEGMAADGSVPMTGGLNLAQGADVVAANALVLGTDGNSFDITGTTNITSIGTLGVGTFVTLHFDEVLTITHHATDLVLPNGANIVTKAGDICTFYEYATGDWRLASFNIGATKGSDVASAAALPVINDGDFFDVTGTTTVTSIDSIGVGKQIVLQFDGALTITHHATDLILPDSADIITTAGDIFVFREYATGDWLLVSRNGVNIQRKGSDVASAIALPLINDGDFFDVTGTTNITSFNSIGVGREITLQFDGALILNHHATDLILPGGANILTAAGDVFTFREYASGEWLLVGQGVAISATTVTISGGVTVTGGASSIVTDAALPIIIGTGAGDDFTINTTGLVYEGDTGEVGIGTLPDAGARLHVHRSSGNTIVRLSTANRAVDGFYLQVVNSTQEMRLFQSEAAAITIWTNGIKRMDIDEAGVVTIPGSLVASGGIQTDGTNTLKTKVIDIGDWNMDSTNQVLVTHGLTLANIRSVTALIRDDADTTYKILTDGSNTTNGETQGMIGPIIGTNISLTRLIGGGFDNTSYDSTSYNRGWVTITFIA